MKPEININGIVLNKKDMESTVYTLTRKYILNNDSREEVIAHSKSLASLVNHVYNDYEVLRDTRAELPDDISYSIEPLKLI